MSFGPLPIRIIAGTAFIVHGLPKLANVAGTKAFFASKMGLPAALALPVGLLEVIGAIPPAITVMVIIT
jgi:putative oxidoreductase